MPEGDTVFRTAAVLREALAGKTLTRADDLAAIAHLGPDPLGPDWSATRAAAALSAEPKYWVYGRAGQPCRRCGTPILTDADGPRVSYWCPSCQR